MQRQIQALMTALLMLLFICSQAFAASTANTWTGSGPFATGLGNKVVTALAVSPDGTKVYAGTMSGTVLSYAVTPPTATTNAATGVTATAATLTATVNANNADSTVSFQYGLDTYYGSTIAAGPATIVGATDAAVSASLTSLLSGTIYHYRVVATNTSGTTYGADQSFTTRPGATTATGATSIADTGFTANWESVAGATSYLLDVSTDNTFASFVTGYNSQDVGSGTSAAVTGPLDGTTYYYRVRAHNGSGNGDYSNTISVLTLPASPVLEPARAITTTGFTASFGSSIAAGYYLDVATDSGFTDGSFVPGYKNKDVGNVNLFAVTGLASGTQYWCRVRAYNATGAGPYSGTISLTIGTTRVVTSAADSGAGSLRQIITDATPGDAITFDPGLSGNTINLEEPLNIEKDLTIDGSAAPGIIINGQGKTTPFYVGFSTAAMRNLQIINGGDGEVGGIYNYGDLTLTNCTLSGNSSVFASSAGAIVNRGTLTVTGSTFSNNSSPEPGVGGLLNLNTATITGSTFSGNSANNDLGGVGAIANEGTLTITGSTFSNNSGYAYGGIANVGTLTVVNSTFSGNTSTSIDTDDIYNDGELAVGYSTFSGNPDHPRIANGGSMYLYNSIIAGTSGDACINYSATLDANVNNLIQDESCSNGGVNFKSGDPLLAPLGNYGGPVQTMALLPGSPAIDADVEGFCGSFFPNLKLDNVDQRGKGRVGFCDLGAFESQGFTLTATAGNNQSATINNAFANPLQATLIETGGSPLPGAGITFTAPGSGSSASLTPGSATTDVNGNAAVTATSNGTAGGPYTVTASVAGLTADFSLTNNRMTQATLTITGPGSMTFGDADAVITTSGGSGTGAVTFDAGSSTACSIVGTKLSILSGTGTCSITATKAADSDYNQATSAPFSVAINKANQAALAITGPTAMTYGDADATITTTGGSGIGAVTFDAGSSTACSIISGKLHIISGTGTCSITATKAGDNNYQAGSAMADVTMAKAAATVSLTPASLNVAYDGTAKVAAATTTPTGLTVTFTYAGSATAPTNAASYAVVATINDANYQGSTSGTLTIAKADQSIAFPSATVSKTYGAADFGVVATISSGLALSYQSSDPNVATIDATTGMIHIAGAGSTIITASQAGTSNVNPASTTMDLTVNKAVITVTADNQSRSAGAADPVFTASYSGFVKGEDAGVIGGTVTFTTDATAASPQGSYTITPVVTGLTAANYTFTPVNGTLAVGLASQTVTFSALEAKTYGAAEFDLSATSSSGLPVTFESGNTGVAVINGSKVTIVGVGEAVITATQAGNASYAQATAQQTLTVNKATLTVKADNKERAYNVANPALTYTVTGFVNGESDSVLSGLPALATAADVTSPVGSYPITVSQSTLTATNYDFTFQSGILAVGLSSQSITFAPLAAKTYGDAAFNLTAESSAGLTPITFESSNPAVATITGNTVTITGAGTATITARQAGNGSYASASVQQTLRVGKALLMVTTQSPTRAYGEPNPVFTPVYSGFKGSDTEAGLQGAPAIVTGTDSATGPGSYSILVMSGNLYSTNYRFSFSEGLLTVTKATATVILGNLSQTYDGTTRAATITTTPAGLTVDVTYDGSVSAPTIGGSYAVVATVNDSNYQGSASGTLTIGKAAATVNLGSLNHTYDGTAKAATATTTPAGRAVTFTYNGSTTAPTAAGSYTVVATINDANYQGSTTGTLTIGSTTQTITFGTAPTVYRGTTGTLSATATSGLTVSFTSTTPNICTVSGSTVTGVAPGTCTIAADQAGNTNYTAASQVTQDIPVTVSISLSVSALADGATTTETTQNVSGTVTNPTYLSSLTINGAAVTVTPAGSFSYPVQLVAGANTITVIATSTAGDVLTDSRTVTLDTTTVQIAIAAPMDNAVVIHPYVTVSGTVTPATATTVTCTVNGGTPQAASISGGDFTCTPSLVLGMNTIDIAATDGIHTAQAKRTVTYAPTFNLTVTDPASDMRTVKSSYTLTGSVAENTTPVTVTITMDGQTYTPAVANDGTFSQALTFTTGKVYQVTVTGTDQNGTTVTVQRNIIYSTPTVAPFTIDDALKALQMAVGVIPPQPDLVQRLDVAPMVNGVSVGDGIIDVEDAIVILKMVVGLI